MDLDRFLNLLASVFGAMGSLYVLKAVATLSPNLIERLSRTYFDFSSAQIHSLTTQKADSIVGVTLVVIALVLAVVTNAAVPSGIKMTERWGVAVALAAALSGVAYVSLAFAGAAIQRHQKDEVGRIIVKQHLVDLYERGKVRDYDVPSLRVLAAKLANLSPREGESARSLVTRLAQAVDMTVPDSLDFSEVEPQPKPDQ